MEPIHWKMPINTISLSGHEQVCLIMLRFERYPIIGQTNDYVSHFLKKYADLDGNNKNLRIRRSCTILVIKIIRQN